MRAPRRGRLGVTERPVRLEQIGIVPSHTLIHEGHAPRSLVLEQTPQLVVLTHQRAREHEHLALRPRVCCIVCLRQRTHERLRVLHDCVLRAPQAQ